MALFSALLPFTILLCVCFSPLSKASKKMEFGLNFDFLALRSLSMLLTMLQLVLSLFVHWLISRNTFGPWGKHKRIINFPYRIYYIMNIYSSQRRDCSWVWNLASFTQECSVLEVRWILMFHDFFIGNRNLWSILNIGPVFMKPREACLYKIDSPPKALHTQILYKSLIQKLLPTSPFIAYHHRYFTRIWANYTILIIHTIVCFDRQCGEGQKARSLTQNKPFPKCKTGEIRRSPGDLHQISVILQCSRRSYA